MLHTLLEQLKSFPEYFVALKAALVVLLAGLPLYLGLRYFIYKRRLEVSLWMTFNFIGAFILFAGLAFLLASPLATYLPNSAVSAYLFVTCLVAAFGAVSLVDVFFIHHYLKQVRQVYVSPPLRGAIKLGVFILTLLPILRYVLHFNPLALVAIPTIATAAIAFALQDTLKAFIAGITLGRMIHIGEWISFDGREGRVVDINWARTVLDTIDGQLVYIPNSALQSGVFLNFTSGNPANRQVLKVGASYDVPPARVKEVLKNCATTTPGVAASPEPVSILVEYGESAVTYGLYYWIDDYVRRGQIQDDVSTRIWYAFKREGIAIPFPIRNIYMHDLPNTAKEEKERLKTLLKNWSLVDAFKDEELEEVAASSRCQLYGPGEVMVKKDSPGQSVFLIISGEADVFLYPEAAQPVSTLGANDTFGEMSFLTGEPRAATIVAKTSVEVLEIDKSGVQSIVAKRPQVSEKLAAVVSKRQAALASAEAKRPNGSSRVTTLPKESLSKNIREFFGLS